MGENKEQVAEQAKETTTEKVVKMDAKKGLTTQEQPKKISYEELGKIASELQMQAQKLYQENHQLKIQLNNQSAVIRMNYLFEVLKNDKFFTPDDCYKCAEEIMESLYPSDIEGDEIGNIEKQELVEEQK